MLKRIAFFFIMLAIPVIGTVGLYYGYLALRGPQEGQTILVEPRGFLANNTYVRRFIYWLSRQHNWIAIDNGRKHIDKVIAGLVKEKGKDYRDNWAEALVFVPIPGVTGNHLPNVRGKYVNTNDLGYRSSLNFLAQIAEARTLKAQGVRIAVFTGGSAGFGLYSDDDQTDIVGYLNQMAGAEGGRVRFYNFAMGSYTSAEELNALVTYAAALEPDLLIVFDGFNDALRLTEPAVYSVGVGVPFMYLSFRQGHAIAFQSEYLDRKYDLGQITPEQQAEFFEHYQRNIRLMARVMASGGGTTIVSTQPIGFFRSICNPPIVQSKLIDNFVKFYPKLIAAAREVSIAQRITYLDLTGLFEGPEEKCRGTFLDSVHMSSAGQKVVADHLYAAVVKALAAKS